MMPVWPLYIAVSAVLATALYARGTRPKGKDAHAPPPPAPDEAEPTRLVAAHAMLGYAYLGLRGVLLDLLEAIVGSLCFWRRRAANPARPGCQRVGPNIMTGWVVFYTRRMYSRIEDCWNRPIAGEASSSIDVCLRRRDGYGDGAPLKMTGETRRCLNLGSYNYLGFGGVEPHVTPAVIETLHKYGVSNCSSRLECGDTPVHRALEEAICTFLEKPAAIVVGMGFATNASLIPVRSPPRAKRHALKPQAAQAAPFRGRHVTATGPR